MEKENLPSVFHVFFSTYLCTLRANNDSMAFAWEIFSTKKRALNLGKVTMECNDNIKKDHLGLNNPKNEIISQENS